MAFSVNHVTLVGNLTRDPELRYTPGGTANLTLNIATNRSVKKDEQWSDVPTYHRVIVWGKMAEWIAKSSVKGDQIYVDGRIDNRSYEKDGQKHYISEVVAENVISMTKKRQERATAPKEQAEPEPAEPKEPGTENVNPDDIPF